MSFFRGDLIGRLAILALTSLAPAAVVAVYLLSGVQAAGQRHLDEDAVHQAQAVHAELQALADSARRLAVAIGEIPAVARFDPSCRPALAALDRILPNYDLLTVMDEDGTVICSSREVPQPVASRAERQQIAGVLAAGVFTTGLYQPPSATAPALLLFREPFAGTGGRRGVIAIGLSLAWLDAHVRTALLPPGASLAISDREGAVLAQIPGADGEAHEAAIPANAAPLALAVRVGIPVAPAAAEFDRLVARAAALAVLGAALSVALGLLAGRRLLRGPTRTLLDAAHAWSRGELGTRLHVAPADRSEFGRLAQAFNAMAEALGRQRAEREDLQATLEARVAERTADLLQSRDRLQVALGEQAKSEASLRQAQKLQAVGQLAGGIAHDFNNLLTAVIGALELLRLRLPADDARSTRLLDNALHAADRGGRLTSQLLAFSRRQRLLPVPTDLNQIVAGMIGLLTTTLGREIRVETALAADLWPALVDPHQVESAILNLAINARDAMPRGGTLRILTANRTLQQQPSPPPGLPGADGLATQGMAGAGDYVMIQVRDTGTGMSADVMARVFEPFFTTKQPGRGSGLGLSQVHGLAAQSGGEARVESEAGAGTTVSLLLPRAAAAPAAVPAEGVPAPLVRHSLHVLVADDDADVRRLTGEMLSELGHTPILVADGAAALAVLDAEIAVDVLLADYAMPGLNGTELIAGAAASRPEVAAILVTGHADVEAPSLAGGHPVLRKPFTMAVLARALEDLQLAPEAARAMQRAGPD